MDLNILDKIMDKPRLDLKLCDYQNKISNLKLEIIEEINKFTPNFDDIQRKLNVVKYMSKMIAQFGYTQARNNIVVQGLSKKANKELEDIIYDTIKLAHKLPKSEIEEFFMSKYKPFCKKNIGATDTYVRGYVYDCIEPYEEIYGIDFKLNI